MNIYSLDCYDVYGVDEATSGQKFFELKRELDHNSTELSATVLAFVDPGESFKNRFQWTKRKHPNRGSQKRIPRQVNADFAQHFAAGRTAALLIIFS